MCNPAFGRLRLTAIWARADGSNTATHFLPKDKAIRIEYRLGNRAALLLGYSLSSSISLEAGIP